MPDLLPRGVYCPRWLHETGERIIIAIASDHRCIFRMPVPEHASLKAYARLARRFLNRLDPIHSANFICIGILEAVIFIVR